MTHRWALAAVITVLAISPGARGEEKEIKRLNKAWRAAQSKWFAEAEKAQEEGREIDVSTNPAKEFRPRFRALAEKHAGKPDVVPLLLWLLREGASDHSDTEALKTAKWAAAQLAKDHASGAAIVEHLQELQWADQAAGHDAMAALFQRVIDENEDRDAKATATLNLAILHMRDGADSSGEARPPRKSARTLAMKLFRSLTEDYADTKAADQAEGYIFEAEHLQIGMKAPELVGKDADGKEINLSQFAGQVVVLDFWGFW